MAAADTARSGASADSYLGSLISLTSKCEIRYEGVLYNINTEESSIGLRNVRSFGTEGRKKDGPQIPPSDKIYEYILFRGSDIKDLQVKSSPPPPPVQAMAPIHNDPAIIQSHYPRPTSTSMSLPSMGSETVPDLSSHTGQTGMLRPTFQGGLPLYQPGGNLSTWGSTPLPTTNASGLAMPMYWQGFYPASAGIPHLQQPSLLRPPPGMSMPHSMQQPLHYPGVNTMPSLPGTNASVPHGSLNLPGLAASFPSGSHNLPEPPPLLAPINTTASLPSTTTTSLSSTTLPLTVTLTQASSLATETPHSLLQNKPLITSIPVTPSPASTLPLVTPIASKIDSAPTYMSSKARSVPGANMPRQSVSQIASTNALPISSQGEATMPPLVTPGQLLQSGPSTISTSQSFTVDSQVDESKPVTSEQPKLTPAEASEPILPLPKPADQMEKPNGVSLHTHHNRGRGRGRGNGFPRSMAKFTEDFDFTAMNEKFNKDEVWGHLGKGKSQSRERGGEADEDDNDDFLEEEYTGSIEHEVKPVYVKDDFFDSLSCNSLDRGNQNGRTKFSEQLKIDSETFGDVPRHHRSIRGGGRGFRGGHARGSYNGRGYGYSGRGGYASRGGYAGHEGYTGPGRGRGRGRVTSNRAL